MFKRLSTLMLGAGAVLAVSAAPLTPNQALSRLSGSATLKSVNKVALNPVLKYSFADEAGQAVAYAFEPAQGSGFMILSADDIAYPVLGYSETGKFDKNNMPEQLVDWIKGYGEEIEYAKSKGITPSTGNIMLTPLSAREAIAPMVKSKWDQGAPYNNECPTVNGVHCVTGCVATSVAQVMNYFKYPEVGTGVARCTVKGTSQAPTLNLAECPFDWSNMLDNYVSGTYNNVQATAVATLMKAAGFAVNMNYGTDASGAVSMVIANALRNYFNYDAGITFEGRVSYSASEWDEKVYNNIKNGSPVIYNGNDLTVGHSFICDGYDGKGYYHINWGWGGMSDGYFLLNALNPEALGTGGGVGGGFNFRQGGVFNICKPGSGQNFPAAGEPTITAYGLLGVSSVTQDAIGRSVINVGILEGYGTMSGWLNESSETVKFSVGGVFKDAATGAVVLEQSGKLGSSYTISPSPGSYYQSTLKLSVTVPDNLPDGDYKMVASTKNSASAITPWVAMKVPYS
ncbi:MAG: C10 family peptidase, partial [Muribaculaceae bacterium]|nr:C10 family peptidase [Muribaculaceae bacterium]